MKHGDNDDLRYMNSSRCINFIEYKQLATVRFNREQHKMLIAEYVSISKRREHGLPCVAKHIAI